MSAIKQSIVNEFRTGLYSIPELSEKYGYPEKAIKNMVNPNLPGRVSSTVVASKYLTKDESKKINQRAAGRKAAETKRLNKLKKLGVQTTDKAAESAKNEVLIREVGVAFDILKDKILKVLEESLKK